MAYRIPGSLREAHREFAFNAWYMIARGGQLGRAVEELYNAAVPHLNKEARLVEPLMVLWPSIPADLDANERARLLDIGNEFLGSLEVMLAEHREIERLARAALSYAKDAGTERHPPFLERVVSHVALEDSDIYPALIVAGIGLGRKY